MILEDLVVQLSSVKSVCNKTIRNLFKKEAIDLAKKMKKILKTKEKEKVHRLVKKVKHNPPIK